MKIISKPDNILLVITLSVFIFLPGIRISDATGEDVTTLHQTARKCYNEGRISQAIETYERILELDPQFLPAYNDAGCCYLEQGNYSKAIERFQRGLAIKPGDLTILFNLCNAYEKSGNPAEVRNTLDKILVTDPASTKARSMLIMTHLNMNNPDAAITEAKKLIMQEPDNIKNEKLLIQAYLKKGDYLNAKAECKKVMAISPNDPEIKVLYDCCRESGKVIHQESREKAPVSKQVSNSKKTADKNSSPVMIILILALSLTGGISILILHNMRRRSEGETEVIEMESAPEKEPDRAMPERKPATEETPETVSHCWQLQKCTSEMKSSCKAYPEGQDCWSFEETPCCKQGQSPMRPLPPLFIQIPEDKEKRY